MRFSILMLMLFACAACRRREKTMSFYYWRTTFAPDSVERATLQANEVASLFIRFFDIDRPPGAPAAMPITPIVFKQPVGAFQVIPVVYCRNRVFEDIDSAAIVALAAHVSQLLNDICASQQIHPQQIQFDCDWTDKTRDSYFAFLRAFRLLSGRSVTCTIRLHQVKYPGRTGIPPVDAGVLMYYNMGNIDAGEGSSIYEPAIAARYIPFLSRYPMDLDIALPIFSWGLQIREGHVLRLLNKMNFLHFQNDTNFTRLDSGRFRAATAAFSGGYYFQAGDIVKIEHPDAPALQQMIREIGRSSNHRLHNIIFYDLDQTNIVLYEKNVFRKVLDRFD